jgi:hypothetical protein
LTNYRGDFCGAQTPQGKKGSVKGKKKKFETSVKKKKEDKVYVYSPSQVA